MGEVNDGAVEAVGDRRAGRAACGVVGPEHEVIDDQLRASLEQVGQGCGAFVDVEPVLLVDPDPGQLLAPPRELVAAPGQLLLGVQQLQPGGKPLVTSPGLVSGHCFSPSCGHNSLAWPVPPMTPHIGGASPGTDDGARTLTIPSPV